MRNNIIIFTFILGAFSLFILSCKKEPIPPTPVPAPFNPTPYTLEYPDHFPQPIIPTDNPLTVEGIELGRFLFYDSTLSGNNTISCASCHMIDHSFSDPAQFSKGIFNQLGKRNSMPLINLAFQPEFFWDGRAASLEQQILMPIQDHLEMAQDIPQLITELESHPVYPEMFNKAFGTENITPPLISKAIAQFLRTIISGDSKYDMVKQKKEFFTQNELEGLQLINDLMGADCFHCHGEGNAMFGDFKYKNNALDSTAVYTDFPDPGRGGVTMKPEDYGLFKTPSLRNVAVTAPYMHDGRFATLEEVLDHYAEGLQPSININEPDFKIHVNKGGTHLTPDEKMKVIAFLHTLTDTSFVNDPTLQNPFK